MSDFNVVLFLFYFFFVESKEDRLYENNDFIFTVDTQNYRTFYEAIMFCRSLPNGEMALIKAKTLAKEIEKQIIALGNRK